MPVKTSELNRKFDKLCCVYQIINILNNKKYIGGTVNLRQRRKEHLGDLRTNKHHSIKLQEAFNEFGENNFKFEPLAKSTKEYLKRMEQWFLDVVNPEYNTSKDATRPNLGKTMSEEHKAKLISINKGHKYHLGKKASDETKAKMSKVRKGKVMGENAKRILKLINSKPVLQYDLEWNFICEYPSVADAGLKSGVMRQNIHKCLAGEQGRAGQFRWKYKEKLNYNNN